MTTVDNLPAETIIEIIRAVTDCEFDAGTLPLSLISCAQVCSRWHTTILGAPDLFNRIFISFSQLLEQNFSITKWARFWFEKSQTLPLTVVIIIPRLGARDTDLFWTFHDLLETYLLPNASRLKSFELDAFLQSSPDALFSPLLESNVDGPILEELVVRCPNTVYPPASAAFRTVSFFASTPKLRSVTIKGLSTIPPLTSLTYLDMYGLDLTDKFFQQLVSDCPELESLALRCIHLPEYTYDNSDSPLTPIPMPRLRNLTLDFGDVVPSPWMDRCKHVSACVVAPNLQSLKVSISPRSCSYYLRSSTQSFGIGLSQILPHPSYLSNLRIIHLQGIQKEVKNDYTRRTVNNSHWFLDLESTDSIEEISLSDSSGEVLGIDLPTPSFGHCEISDPTVSVGRSDSSQFMNLKSITMDSALPKDILWLCRVISTRPSIQRVYLPKAEGAFMRAALHLVVTESGVFSRRELGSMVDQYGSDESDEDRDTSVEEWLRERVELWLDVENSHEG
ncbi:hypothetical protein L218DRAFT_1002641 [Marasmius fiardii PR-910]|nr:hypothetical protein L218DRAFT_1002641 [Marasmius fiardii PR-910]